MPTPNRNYSDAGSAQLFTVGNVPNLSSIATNLVLAGQGDPSLLPVAPFAIQIDNEVILVPAAGNIPFNPGSVTIQRGYDGTNAAEHDTGASVRHVYIQADFAEPQQHLNNTTPGSMHGLPANAWLGGQYQLIQHDQLGSNQSSYSVPSISQSFTHLFMLTSVQSTDTGSSGVVDLLCQINGISSGSYTAIDVRASMGGSTASSLSATSHTASVVGGVGNQHSIDQNCGSTFIWFPYYSNTSAVKQIYGYSWASDGTLGQLSYHTSAVSGTSGSGVSSLIFTLSGGNLVAGSSFWLYGV